MGRNQTLQTPCAEISLKKLPEFRTIRVVTITIDDFITKMKSVMNQLTLNIFPRRIKLVPLCTLRRKPEPRQRLAPTPQRRLTDAPGCAGASGGSGRQIEFSIRIGAMTRLQRGRERGEWIVCTCRHMSADTFLVYIAGPCARPIGKLANIGD